MEEFPNTEQAAKIILEIIRTAQNRIVLISPFVDPTEIFYNELEQASISGKNILLVCVESKLKYDVKNRLRRINNLEILNNDSVHAKCYYNEELLLQTSLNISKFSEVNNIENGSLFKRKENPDRFYKASALPEMIVRDAIGRINRTSGLKKPKHFTPLNSYNFDNLKLTFFKEINNEKGFCIRCGTNLNYLNGNFPLCSSCYRIWAQFNEWNFQENRCHWCGERYTTTKRKPLCLPCYRRYQGIIKSEKEADSITEPKTESQQNLQSEPVIKPEAIVENFNPERKAPSVNKNPNKKKIISLILLVILLTVTWSTINYFHNDKSEIKSHDVLLIETVKNYFEDINKQGMNVSKFFAPTIENYIKAKNLVPKNVDSLLNVSKKEFMYGNSQILDSIFSIGKDSIGNTDVKFWINFKCFRKSKAQYEKCKVHEEFVFDRNDKIISVNELQILDLKFSFQDPD